MTENPLQRMTEDELWSLYKAKKESSHPGRLHSAVRSAREVRGRQGSGEHAQYRGVRGPRGFRRIRPPRRDREIRSRQERQIQDLCRHAHPRGDFRRASLHRLGAAFRAPEDQGDRGCSREPRVQAREARLGSGDRLVDGRVRGRVPQDHAQDLEHFGPLAQRRLVLGRRGGQDLHRRKHRVALEHESRRDRRDAKKSSASSSRPSTSCPRRKRRFSCSIITRTSPSRRSGKCSK